MTCTMARLLNRLLGEPAHRCVLLFDEFASELILNDADPRIYAFWRAVLNQTDELVHVSAGHP